MNASAIVVPIPGIQAKLGWVYSLYAGIFAFLFSLFFFSSGSGAGFALLAGASALVAARLAAWIAGYFGRSRYGLIACAITAILFSLTPLGFLIVFSSSDLFGTEPIATLAEFLKLMVLFFVIGIAYAAPAALAATLVFHLALVIVRKQRWLAFEQQWL